jgi:hypothetical protein
MVVEAGWQLLEYRPKFAAAGIYLRGFWREMECDTGGAVASEEVAQIRADPLPDLVAVGSGIVLQPDGEGVPCGLQHLIAVYARGFFNPGGDRHGQQYDVATARAGKPQDLIGASLHRDGL